MAIEIHKHTITIRVKTFKGGPWSPLNVSFVLEEFINAPIGDEYIIRLASMSFMGSEDLEFQFNYTQEQAKEDLKLAEEFHSTH